MMYHRSMCVRVCCMVLLLGLLCSCAPSTSSEVPSSTPSAAPTPTLTPAPTAVATCTASEAAQLDSEEAVLVLTDDTYKCGDDFPAGSYIFIPFSGACTFAVMRKDFSMDVNLALVSQTLLQSLGYTIEELQEGLEDVDVRTSITEPITFEEGDYLYIVRALDDEAVKILAYRTEAGASEEGQASSEPPTTPTNEPASTPSSEANDQGYVVDGAQVTLWTRHSDSQWMQVVVPIRNTGEKKLYIDKGSYDIEKADGSLIGVESYVPAYPQVLAPGEVGYLYQTTVLDEVLEEDPVIVPHADIKEATVDLIRYEVTDVNISTGKYGAIKAVGRVKKPSDAGEDSMYIYIAMALYDKDGRVIDVLNTIIADELAAGEQMAFELNSLFIHDQISADMVAGYDVWAYPAQVQF